MLTQRDVIFISIGYARDESGFLGMKFGLLSNDGGERLNVLISRAKEPPRDQPLSSLPGKSSRPKTRYANGLHGISAVRG